MPHTRSVLSLVSYSNKGYVLDHQRFDTEWSLDSPCRAGNPQFFSELTRSLASTSFPVNTEMQTALRDAVRGLQDSNNLIKFETPLYERVQLSYGLACNVKTYFKRVSGKTCLEVCNGSLVTKYNTTTHKEKNDEREIKTGLPVLCLVWTAQDGSALLLNSWSYPIKKKGMDNTGHLFRIAQPAFSQHFIVTESTTFSQAPTRHVVQLKDLFKSNKHVNRNVLKLEHNHTTQSHRDSRILQKTEHTAIRHACGFSDSAWENAVLTTNREFSAWSTGHKSGNVCIVSLFLH